MDRPERLERWDSAPRPLVTPSLLACDFARMAEVLAELHRAGAIGVHLDIMDGHFVPNLSYGAPLIRDWRAVSDLPFDAHLMMSDPGRYLDDFVSAGCDQIVIHIEVLPDPTELLRRIRRAGCRAALALNPPTPVDAIRPYLAELDSVLVMSVMPGFGGQQFQGDVLEKVRDLRSSRPGIHVAIDGGINPSTAALAALAGVTQLVAGSAVFHSGSQGTYAAALGELTEAARRASPRGGAAAPGADRPSHE